MKKKGSIFYISVLVIYIILLVPIVYLGALLKGIPDFRIILILGLLNSYISNTYFKTKLWYSLVIGFLISALGLITSYILFVPFLINNFFFAPLFLNAISQTISWKFVDKFCYHENKSKLITLSGLTIMSLLLSFNLYEYWKFEKYYNWNKKKRIFLKLVDSKTGKSIVGDSIRLSARRPLLYGMSGGSTIGKTIIDENGFSEFMVYPNNDHIVDVWKNNKFPYYFFEVGNEEIIEVDTIEIKTTANNTYSK